MKTKRTLLGFLYAGAMAMSTCLWSCSINANWNISKLIINGSLKDISKDTSVMVNIEYCDLNNIHNFKCDTTAKVQGNTSAHNIKKNFNINLFKEGTDYQIEQDVVVNDNWDLNDKYTLKANYSDILGIHNICGCKIWGDIIHQTKHVERLDKLINGGAIDGFPIVLYNNEELLGLYTFNLRKNKDLFGMTKDGYQSMFLAKKPTQSTLFKQKITDCEEDGWDIEFCSTNDEQWVLSSMNNFINFINNVNDKETFLDQINNYSNLDSLIDYYVYIDFVSANDNICNNIMWITYDGQHWLPSVYDFDYSFGWNVRQTIDKPDSESNIKYNLLFNKLSQYCWDKIQNEYFILRKDSLSLQNIFQKFTDTYNAIPEKLFKADLNIWPREQEANTLENLIDFMNKRATFYDEKMRK